MATQALRCFLDLPRELQFVIWEYAFDAENPNGHRVNPNQFNGIWKSRQRFTSPYSSKKVLFNLGWRQQTGIGTRVIRACRLSRLIALQSWTRMVRGFAPHSNRFTTADKVSKHKDLIARIFCAL